MAGDPNIARLLEHPAIWRGRSAAAQPPRRCPSGFAALDEHLPGRGWPRSGLIEILVPRFGSGELRLLLPVLAALTRAATARWCVWVTPPLLPFAPALVAGGVVLERVAVVGGARPLWAFEQTLRSGACDAVLAWARQPRPATSAACSWPPSRGARSGCCSGRARAAREASSAVLRLGLEPQAGGVRVTLLKARGAPRTAFCLEL